MILFVAPLSLTILKDLDAVDVLQLLLIIIMKLYSSMHYNIDSINMCFISYKCMEHNM